MAIYFNFIQVTTKTDLITMIKVSRMRIKLLLLLIVELTLNLNIIFLAHRNKVIDHKRSLRISNPTRNPVGSVHKR